MTITENQKLNAIGEMLSANTGVEPATEPVIEQADGEFERTQTELSAFITSNIQHRNRIAKRVP